MKCGYEATGGSAIKNLMTHAKKSHMNELREMREKISDAEVKEMMKLKVK